MKTRDVYLEQGKTLGNSGTETIDISPVDPISEIVVNMWATNGATSNKDAPIPRVISKIEIVDGADVQFSMDGRMAHALYFYMSGKKPQASIREEGGESQACNIPLRFGRYLWDKELALDTTKFKNAQLKITWNLEAVRAVGATGFVSNSLQMSIIARVMEELEAPPIGYMMHKDHYSFTSAASGDERIALPTDHPYVMAMIRAYDADVDMADSISNVKLDVDFGKFVPLDMEMGDLINRAEDVWGDVMFDILFEGDSSETHEHWLGAAKDLKALAVEPGLYCSEILFNAGQYQLGIYDAAGAAQTVKTVDVAVRGQCPWNCVALQFGVLEDPTTYFDATKHGDIKAVLTQGAANAVTNLALTQMRLYAPAGA